MQPVRIKYLGLIPMTRRGYLMALAAAVVIAAGLLTAAGLAGKLPPVRSLWQNLPPYETVYGASAKAKLPAPPVQRPTVLEYWFANNLYRILLICLIAEIIDTYLVLRRFSKKEKEQRAQQLASQSG